MGGASALTPARKFLRNLWERWRHRYYEGPEAPDRLSQVVLEFAAINGKATKGEWIEFAAGLARESYRSGYVRGHEWAERDLDRRDPLMDPEVVAEHEGHDWEWIPFGQEAAPSELDEVVPDVEEPVEDEVRRHVEEHF